jgi:Leucine-rich repeat (LRR) protein
MDLSDAIASLIRSLNLTSFPCGSGNWRNEALKEYDIQMHESSVGQEESVSVLQSYCRGLQTPWHVDCDWSDEAQTVRDLSVTSPHVLKDPDMIYKYFKTLYIRGRKVTNVDKGLLKFINLRELILSVNSIAAVEGRNLPRGLQVLELCGNSISDMHSLSLKAPPGLLYVGLSYNAIPNIQCLEQNLWSHLLSLDLSYNHLISLTETTKVLSKLPKLRTLSLMENPLALVAAYRPYVISLFPQLTYFDEVQILSDDHSFCKNFSSYVGTVSY